MAPSVEFLEYLYEITLVGRAVQRPEDSTEEPQFDDPAEAD